MALLADCADASPSAAQRVGLALVLALIVVVWTVAVVRMLRGADPEDRGHLVLAFLGAIAIGAALFLERGLGSHDHLGRFFLGLAVSVGFALLVSGAGRHASLVRSLGLSIAGAVLVPGLLVLLLVAAFGIEGYCLD